MFVVFAAAAVIWSLLVLRATLRRGGGRSIVVASCVAVAAAVVSIVIDVRAMQLARRAEPADVAIRIVARGDWFELAYEARGTAFITANELHVPIGGAVALSWSGLPPPWIDGAVCLPRGEDRCTLVARGDGAARFIALKPRMWRRLPIVAEPRPRFEQWLRGEASPARADAGGAALFESAGCGYCHVVRGAVASPSQIAPDLTHFASRRTIAATALPNRRGFIDGWIVHSAALKRGSAMPDNRLDPRVLRGIIAYLESLR
jgi:cytochrome c oxidase subunit 2